MASTLTSGLDVTVMPDKKETFVELSDGSVVYARGEGDTFDSAMEDLTAQFLMQQDDKQPKEHEDGSFPLQRRGAIIDV